MSSVISQDVPLSGLPDIPATPRHLVAWNRIRPILLPALTAVMVLMVWEFVCRFYAVPKVILPAPSEVWRVLSFGLPLILPHAVPTTLEALAGFTIAGVMGIALASAITYSRLLREALYPNMVVFQLIPKIALAPLFIVWLGIGSESRLAFATFISFFPVVIATATGLSQVHPDMIRLGQSLTATKWQIFRTIRFPFAMPYIFSGLKIAVTMSMIGVIVGEFITAQQGLGYLILFASSKAETGLILACIALLCVIGLALFGVVALAERLAKHGSF
jgi:NitT/TauT family transport system permease protein